MRFHSEKVLETLKSTRNPHLKYAISISNLVTSSKGSIHLPSSTKTFSLDQKNNPLPNEVVESPLTKQISIKPKSTILRRSSNPSQPSFLQSRGTFHLVSRTFLAPDRVSVVYLPKRRGISWADLFKWKKSSIEKEANESPDNPELQAQLLRSWNQQKRMRDVQFRFESGKYAINEECKKEYIKALVQLEQFDNVNLQSFLMATTVGEEATSTSTSTTPPTTTTIPRSNNYNPWSTGTISVEIVKTPRNYGMVIVTVLGLITSIIICIFLFSLLGRGSIEDKGSALGSFPVSNAHTLSKNVTTKFDDVKGIDESKQELIEVVEYLKNPQKFTRLGAKLPKGVLLMGEPGTGKTLLARAIAGEAEVPFLYCSGSSFDELFVGVGPRRIRSLFADAKKLAPCIIFIDEIDAIGTSRKLALSSSYTKESTLNQLLTELDGFQQTEGIIIIGATNFPDVLDSALTRPGRFDKQIHIPTPDIKGRKEIIDLYLKKTQISPDVDSRTLARGTPGFTGADLFNLINLAAIKATIKDKKFVDMDVLEEAKDDILMGIQRKGVEQTLEDRKMTAYHEGGHALIALLTEGATPLHKATIIQRGAALGMTVQLPETDEVSFSKKQLMASLAVCMGGRAAEELIYGSDGITTGASSDFKQATSMARNMVSKWGMSDKVGKLYIPEDIKKVSSEQSKLIDDEVKELLNSSYNYAFHMLKTHTKELDRIANALLEYETLTAEEIKLIFEGKSLSKKI